MHHPTDRIAHTTGFVTPVVEQWLERENVLYKEKEDCIKKKNLQKNIVTAIKDYFKCGIYMIIIWFSDSQSDLCCPAWPSPSAHRGPVRRQGDRLALQLLDSAHASWRYTRWLKVHTLVEGTHASWRYTQLVEGTHVSWRYTRLVEGTHASWRYTRWLKVHTLVEGTHS